MKERLLSRVDEDSISIATVKRPFSFDGDGASFQPACEAKRIDFAFLFDPLMAVHTSYVAGKTITAGLYIGDEQLRASQ